MRASSFITGLAARGLYTFTTAEAAKALNAALPAVRASLRRLKAKGDLADPHQGFHVVVPPEYRRLGCLPAEQFMPQLMEHLGEPYYVALLSAAQLHGAAHQRPQTLQVMVRKNRRPIECGSVRVQFIARKNLEDMSVVSHKTPRGLLRVASPETTVLELIGYEDRSGGLDNVAAVVAELGETLDGKKLVREAMKAPIAWSQRLGYLLDNVGRPQVANAIASIVRDHAKDFAPLARKVANADVPVLRNERWKLIINANVEPDL